jgi:hypothetical protein
MPKQPKHATTNEALDLDIRALARVKNLRGACDVRHDLDARA